MLDLSTKYDSNIFQQSIVEIKVRRLFEILRRLEFHLKDRFLKKGAISTENNHKMNLKVFLKHINLIIYIFYGLSDPSLFEGYRNIVNK